MVPDILLDRQIKHQASKIIVKGMFNNYKILNVPIVVQHKNGVIHAHSNHFSQMKVSNNNERVLNRQKWLNVSTGL